MDTNIKDLLTSITVEAQTKLNDYEKKQEDSKTKKIIQDIGAFHDYLKLAEKNKDVLIRKLIIVIMERYLGYKERSVFEIEIPNNSQIHTSYHLITDHDAKLYHSYLDFYKKEGKNYPEFAFLKKVRVTDSAYYQLEYDDYPVVKFMANPSRSEPALVDTTKFAILGFRFLKESNRLEAITSYTKLEECVKGMLDKDFGLDEYLTKEEIDGYRARINKANYGYRKAKLYKSRCTNGLETILCDITKELINDFNSGKTPSSNVNYVAHIPFYIRNHQGSNFVDIIDNTNADTYLVKKIGKRELNLRNWMNDNTVLCRQDICYFPHKKEDSSIEYIPFLFDELNEKLAELGWKHKFYASSYGKKNAVCDALEIRVNSLKFIKQVLKLSNENQKRKK